MSALSLRAMEDRAIALFRTDLHSGVFEIDDTDGVAEAIMTISGEVAPTEATVLAAVLAHEPGLFYDALPHDARTLHDAVRDVIRERIGLAVYRTAVDPLIQAATYPSDRVDISIHPGN